MQSRLLQKILKGDYSMGEINVSSIKNKFLREAAQNADEQGNKDGVLNSEKEISVFEDYVQENKVLKKLKTMTQYEEYQSIIKTVRKDTSYQDVIETGAKENVYEQAEQVREKTGNPMLDNIFDRGFESREQLMMAIDSDKAYSEFSKDEAYVAINAIKDVINAVRLDSVATLTYDKIEKAYDKAAKKLPKDDEHKRALEIVKDITMRERQAYFRSELEKDYNPEKIVEEGGSLKAEAKKAKKKYKNDPDFKREYNNFKEFKDERNRELSVKQANEIIGNAEGTKALKVDRDAYKEIKKVRKETGNKDLQVYYENSDEVRSQLRQRALDNNVEDKRIQSEEDVLRQLSYTGNVDGKYGYVLKDERKAILFKLEHEGYIERLDDGMLDLSNLSRLIGGQVGADNTLSKTKKDFKPVSELNGLKSELSLQTDLVIDEKTAKDLARLCGYKVETLNWENFVKNLALIGFTVAAAAAAPAAGVLAGAALAPQYGVRAGDNIYSHFEVKINDIANLYSDLAPEKVAKLTPEQLAKKLDEIFSINSTAAKKELVDGALRVTIDTEILTPDEIILATENLGAAVLGAALGGAIAALPALFSAVEIPAAAADVNTDCIEDYVKHVYAKNEDKQTALMLSTLAMECFDKDGKWDAQLLRDKMQVIKGGDSLLNKRELQNYFRNRENAEYINEFNARIEQLRKDRTKECPPEEVVEKPEDKPPVVTTPEVNEKIATATKKEEKEVEKFNANASDWDTLLALYPCFNDDPEISKLTKADKKRLLKLAQAIKDGEYSKERMLELLKHKDTDKAKDVEYLKGLDYFDYDVYYNQVHATYFENEANMVLPKEFAGCTRPDIIIKNNDGGRDFLKTDKKYEKSDKANKGATTVKTKKETYLVKYLDNDGNKVEEEYTDMLERNNRVEEIKSQKLGTQIQKVTVSVNEWEEYEDYKKDDLK